MILFKLNTRLISLYFLGFLVFGVLFNIPIFANKMDHFAVSASMPLYNLDQIPRPNLIRYVAYYKDDSGKSGLKEILNLDFQRHFTLNRQLYPMFGYSKGNVWGTFIVNNNLKTDASRYLVFEIPYNDSSEVFYYKNGQWKSERNSLEESFDNRVIQNRKVIYRLDFTPGESQVYFRVWSSGSLEPIVSLVSLEELARKNYIEMFGNGIYMGIVVVMFFYNLFLFITIRDRTYLYYVLFIFSFWWGQAAMDGYLREFIFRENAELLKFTRIISGTGALAFSLLFTIHFLQLKVNFPKIYRFFRAFLYVFILPFILYATGGFSPAVRSVLYGILFLGICYIAIGIVSLKKSAYAKYYLLGWVFFLFGGITFAIKMWGWVIPYFTPYAMKLGSALEVTILSLGLGYRIRILSDENRKLSMISQEVELAAKFQSQLFPEKNFSEKNLTMAFHYIPGETISGDFLDYAKDSLGRTVFLISDVSGHGYSAGLIASMVKIAFQSTVKETANGSEQMGKINNMLYGHIHHNFVTASSLRIDLEKKEAEFVCCGHFPLIQYNRNTKQLKQHKPAGIPLGVTSNSRFEGVKISLEPGNRFVLYTDGLIEETNQIDEEFGADRLFEEIRAKGHFNTSQFSGYLKDTIQQWNFGKIREDDIAFIVIDID